MKKLVLKIVIGLVILLALGFVAVALSINRTVKHAVEAVGPKLTGVSVKLEAVNLSLLSGSGTIKGLQVGNPEGFKTPDAIRVGTASLALRPGSLLSDKIVIRSIKVESPEVTLEAGLRGSNLGRILDNVEAATAGSDTNAPAAEPGPAGAQKKLQVDDFAITGARLNLNITGMSGRSVPLVLPPIHLANLGQGSEGITAGELTRRALQAIVQEALKAASEKGYDVNQLTRDLTTRLDKMTDQAATNVTSRITDFLKKKK